MGRIVAIDYGLKRTGLAVTDPLQLIATALTTIETPRLFNFLKDYCQREKVSMFLIGEPKNLDDSETHASAPVAAAIKRLKKLFPAIPVQTIDERYSSKLASRAMIDMGMKKKQRQEKGMIDQIAATMLLQEYLSSS